jgi:hypothetical protein
MRAQGTSASRKWLALPSACSPETMLALWSGRPLASSRSIRSSRAIQHVSEFVFAAVPPRCHFDVELLIGSKSSALPGPRHAVVLAQPRCPAAVADFVPLSWIVQPCPEAGEAKPQRRPHVIMDKHFANRQGLRQVENVLHVAFLMCLPRCFVITPEPDRLMVAFSTSGKEIRVRAVGKPRATTCGR